MTKADLAENFRKRFTSDPQHFFFCPGRVNLIGEHIDYNGGLVMPFAISLGTYLVMAPNNDNVFRFASINFPETGEIPLQSSYTKIEKYWYNFPLGVIDQFLQKGHKLSGMDMLFYGNLPVGAGVSSSASIEVLTAYALSQVFGIAITNPEIAVLAKKVENEFIGLSSGIMDQFAVAMGKEKNALLLNCDTLDYRYIPFDSGDYQTVIINSKKQRSLAESKYNERFNECREALKQLQQELTIDNLCDIDTATFEKHAHLITNPVVKNRALHVVSENDRVKKAGEALQSGNIEELGELLYASHQSLQELYEVSGKELDSIVEFAQEFDGCIGARMTGAGFGGCAIALVKKNNTAAFAEGLVSFYEQKIGYKPEVIISEIGDGVKAI